MVQVTGSLQVKNGIYQAVLSYKQDEKWKTKWTSTKIKAQKRNQKQAEIKLEEIKIHFQDELNNNNSTNTMQNVDLQKTIQQNLEHSNEQILFIDFMKKWLEIIKPSVEETTHSSYTKAVYGKMATYFQNKKITLQNLKPTDIQEFYQHLINIGLTGNTVGHYHANIRKALQYAVKIDLIQFNIADKVELPKVNPYPAKYYTREEILLLFKIIKDTKLETPVLLASFYGLRRSEIVGLKWEAIDFKNKTISINHVVNQISQNHHNTIVKKDRTKNKSSTRTLPLLPAVENYLLKLKEKQKYNKLIYGRKYNKEFSDYICVDKTGNLLYPDYITRSFRNMLKKNKLKVHRFHDLRHSIASLLLKEGIHMKQIQVWLGHSSYNTTANIYAHLDTSGMKQSACVISNVLNTQ